MKNGGKSILAEYNDKNNLSEPSRHKLVNILVDMLIERHGLYPPTIEKISIAKAALILFPKFKVNGTKYGIVSPTHSSLIFAIEIIFIHRFRNFFTMELKVKDGFSRFSKHVEDRQNKIKMKTMNPMKMLITMKLKAVQNIRKMMRKMIRSFCGQ